MTSEEIQHVLTHSHIQFTLYFGPLQHNNKYTYLFLIISQRYDSDLTAFRSMGLKLEWHSKKKISLDAGPLVDGLA